MNTSLWLIDDDSAYVNLLRAHLERAISGVEISQFVNCVSVTRALESEIRPSGVILDMMLPWDECDKASWLLSGENPAKNGIRLAECLIARGIHSNVIGVITAVYEASYREPLTNLGIPASNIIIKPAPVDEIIRLVKRITAT